MKSCCLPPIKLASDESRSPPMVLVGGGVAGGAAATPPSATGVPMLPAVLPAVLPPVLWGVTAGISKSPNPSNTWGEGGSGGTSEKQHRLQTCKSLILLQHGQQTGVRPDRTVGVQSSCDSIGCYLCLTCTIQDCQYVWAFRGKQLQPLHSLGSLLHQFTCSGT